MYGSEKVKTVYIYTGPAGQRLTTILETYR